MNNFTPVLVDSWQLIETYALIFVSCSVVPQNVATLTLIVSYHESAANKHRIKSCVFIYMHTFACIVHITQRHCYHNGIILSAIWAMCNQQHQSHHRVYIAISKATLHRELTSVSSTLMVSYLAMFRTFPTHSESKLLWNINSQHKYK